MRQPGRIQSSQRKLHEKALIIRKQIFGEDHAAVATSYDNFALVYYTLGEYNQGKELHENCTDDLETNFRWR